MSEPITWPEAFVCAATCLGFVGVAWAIAWLLKDDDKAMYDYLKSMNQRDDDTEQPK